MVQTGLQYVFFYIGLVYTTRVRASILNVTTDNFSVLLAYFFYQNDKLSIHKSAGCLLGFAGISTVTLALVRSILLYRDALPVNLLRFSTIDT